MGERLANAFVVVSVVALILAAGGLAYFSVGLAPLNSSVKENADSIVALKKSVESLSKDLRDLKAQSEEARKKAETEAAAAKATEALIAAARAEGKLVILGSVPEIVQAALNKVFQERYPFISVEYFRLGGAAVIERFLAEKRAGKVSIDVLISSDVIGMTKLVKDGGLQKYVPSEAVNLYPWAIGPDGHWIISESYLLTISYNTKLVSATDAPKSWKDLLDPKWQGKIALSDPRLGGGSFSEHMMLRKILGVEYWQKLAAQKPGLFGGHGPMAKAVAAGEYYIGDIGHDTVFKDAKAGAPLTSIIPAEGTFINVQGSSIVEGASHPNAAKLYMEFTATKEAVAIRQREAGFLSTRKDMPILPPDVPITPKITKFEDLKGLEIVPHVEEFLRLRETWLNDWERIFIKGQ